MISAFRVMVYEKYNTLTLLDDLTHRLTGGSYSSKLHGGCDTAKLTFRGPLDALWIYLRAEAQAGRHFAHLIITEGLEWKWEGRIVDIGLGGSRVNAQMAITALGYWSSCRDVEIKSDLTYSSKTVDFIIKDLLTTYCPDINSDQAGIETVAGSISPTLTGRQYTQDIIVKDLAPLGDSSNNVFRFSIGEDRIPFYKKRDVTTVHWEAYLADMASWNISQGVQNARKTIRANDGTTTHNAQDATDWPTAWPDRDLIISVPAGIGATAADDAATRAAAEKGRVQNTGTRFVISARPERLATVNPPLGSRSAIQAGDILRVVDLFPSTPDAAAFDQLRTFCIGKASYDLVRDTVMVQPDDPPSGLDVLLARMGLELKR